MVRRSGRHRRRAPSRDPGRRSPSSRAPHRALRARLITCGASSVPCGAGWLRSPRLTRSPASRYVSWPRSARWLPVTGRPPGPGCGFGERAVRAGHTVENSAAVHHLAVYRAMLDLGPIAEALPGAEQAYRDLPPGTWHASSCLIVGASRFALGDGGAEAILTEGAAEAKLSGAHSIEALCRAHLSIVLSESGDRSRSAHEARSARRILDDSHLLDMPTMALVIAVSSHVEASDGDLERARSETALARRQLVDLAEAGAVGERPESGRPGTSGVDPRRSGCRPGIRGRGRGVPPAPTRRARTKGTVGRHRAPHPHRPTDDRSRPVGVDQCRAQGPAPAPDEPHARRHR